MFTPVTAMPFPVNNYALSKVWYCCHTINPREGDYIIINSSAKCWLYADMLFKPEGQIFFHNTKFGGLGLTSIKHKALACLLKKIMNMTLNKKFNNSIYLTQIFHSHVLA